MRVIKKKLTQICSLMDHWILDLSFNLLICGFFFKRSNIEFSFSYPMKMQFQCTKPHQFPVDLVCYAFQHNLYHSINSLHFLWYVKCNLFRKLTFFNFVFSLILYYIHLIRMPRFHRHCRWEYIIRCNAIEIDINMCIILFLFQQLYDFGKKWPKIRVFRPTASHKLVQFF